ncbi:hypothetical protein ACLB2K_059332 [Fragaria x ananassa]
MIEIWGRIGSGNPKQERRRCRSTSSEASLFFYSTVHMLEKESGVFFNIKYFEECLTNGEWDEAENYLSGFTKLDENDYSFSTFFEIRKQRYLDALDRHDHAKAVQILQKDLEVFSDHKEGTYNQWNYCDNLVLTCRQWSHFAVLSLQSP